jgi:hypothetical protein
MGIPIQRVRQRAQEQVRALAVKGEIDLDDGAYASAEITIIRINVPVTLS